MKVVIHDSYVGVPDAWDELVGEGSPFLELAFLRALERTGCATPETGWAPRPVCVLDGAGRLVAAAPAWLKGHSMGEFVYDHAWAQLAANHRLGYYPKLVVGAPFTPVTGQRLLLREGAPPEARDALLRGLQEASRGAHGLHVLFDGEAEAAELERAGAFSRIQYQYWWRNRGWRDFEDFLGAVTAKARKNLRRERRELRGLRFERVLDPDPARIDHLYRFYASTTQKYVWGNQYLTRELFEELAATWRGRVLGVLAWDGPRCVGGAWDVVKGDRLYGRYWGCDEEIPFLHFEVCYYQGIDHALECGLAVFEPGHGGEHKYRRGFLPEITWSSHWLAHPGLHRALADYSQREAAWVREQVDELAARSIYAAAPAST